MWRPPRQPGGRPPSLTRPQPEFSRPLRPPQPHPSGSRLPYMVTAGPPTPGRPPAPRPHRTQPPPCSPRAERPRPAMEDLGEWGSGPLVRSSSPPSGPAFPCWEPLAFPLSPIPAPSSGFWSLPAPPSRLHVPLPAAPFLPLPGPAAPSLLPSLSSCIRAADGWAGRRSAHQRAPGLGGAGEGGVHGVWGPGTGKVVWKGEYDVTFWRRKQAHLGVWGRKEFCAPEYGRGGVFGGQKENR